MSPTRLATVCLVACGPTASTPAVVTLPPAATVTVATEAPPPSIEPPPAATSALAAPEVLAQGKPTLVHFFASWCEPCKTTLPELDAIYKKHGGRVAVIAIGEDDDESDMRAFVARMGVVYTVLWDSAKAKASRWHVAMMPETYVIDARGALRFTHAGHHDGEGEALESEVSGLLAER